MQAKSAASDLAEFQGRIRAAMMRVGLPSLSALAKRANVNRGIVYRLYEGGPEHAITLKRLAALLATLDCTFRWLALGNGPLGIVHVPMTSDEDILLATYRDMEPESRKAMLAFASKLIH